MRAATKVFARTGYFNSKVADIARAAGVADGTVYLYFKSKEEILRSIFERNTSEAVRADREEAGEDQRTRARSCAASRDTTSNGSATTATSRSSFRSNCAARRSSWRSFPPRGSPSTWA